MVSVAMESKNAAEAKLQKFSLSCHVCNV